MDHETLRRLAGQRNLHIAIDGPAGAGKSTVGQGVARVLDCAYLDTGLMYRAVAWLAMTQGIDSSDGSALGALARDTSFSLPGKDRLAVNNTLTGDELRTSEVDATVSEVSAHSSVRTELVARQRDLAEGRCIVMVGRDIGTTVLPHAPVKLWVTASMEERARRRLSEGLHGSSQNEADVMRSIRERDAYDAGRAASPLRRAVDAIDVHTDSVSPDEALRQALTVIATRLRAEESDRTDRAAQRPTIRD